MIKIELILSFKSLLLILTLSSLFLNICLCDEQSVSINVNYYKKCCNDNEHLIFLHNDNVYNCTLNNYKLYNYYRPNTINNIINNTKTYCIDISIKHINVNLLLLNENRGLVNDIDLRRNQVQKFHKCCPLGYVYEKNERKCVISQSHNTNNSDNDDGDRVDKHRNLIKNVSLVTVGFLHCNRTVLRDVFFNDYNDAKSYAENLNFEQYCFDQTTDNDYVIRKCENINVCDDSDVICLHKCCPDGYNYNKSKKCSNYPYFESGFDYTSLTKTKFKRK